MKVITDVPLTFEERTEIVRTTKEIINSLPDEVQSEAEIQDQMWGVRDQSYGEWMLILQEEFGELAQAILQLKPEEADHEAIQCITLLVRIVEKLRRESGNK